MKAIMTLKDTGKLIIIEEKDPKMIAEKYVNQQMKREKIDKLSKLNKDKKKGR